MMPLIARNLLESIGILAAAARLLAEKAVDGFAVNREALAQSVETSPILATALSPAVGYEKAAEIAKRACAENRPVREVAAEMTDLTAEELKRLLDPRRTTEGGTQT